MSYAATESERLSMLAAAKAYCKRNAIKRAAHKLVDRLIKSGEIVKAPCCVCGDSKAEAHHDDYAHPSVVRWMCREHHKAWHNLNGEAPNAGANQQRVKRNTARPPASKFVGVTWDAERGKWAARLRHPNGNRKSRHDTERGAARAYDAFVGAVCPGALKCNFPGAL